MSSLAVRIAGENACLSHRAALVGFELVLNQDVDCNEWMSDAPGTGVGMSVDEHAMSVEVGRGQRSIGSCRCEITIEHCHHLHGEWVNWDALYPYRFAVSTPLGRENVDEGQGITGASR